MKNKKNELMNIFKDGVLRLNSIKVTLFLKRKEVVILRSVGIMQNKCCFPNIADRMQSILLLEKKIASCLPLLIVLV